MTTLFISDLHLSEHRPELTSAFLRFLRTTATQADALYILGDLFEFWIGDDEASPLQRQIEQALQALHQQGIALFYQHGNRDFMVGKTFARHAGLTLLPPIQVITLAGRRCLLLHGDELCLLDQAYQRYRRITSWRWLQWLFLRLPLSQRLKIAAKIRRGSKQGKQAKPAAWMDVVDHEVERLMRQHGAVWMIHGHTHKPARHELGFQMPDLAGSTHNACRFVLGDWEHVFTYLSVEGDNARLLTEPVTPSVA